MALEVYLLVLAQKPSSSVTEAITARREVSRFLCGYDMVLYGYMGWWRICSMIARLVLSFEGAQISWKSPKSCVNGTEF
jgi:hypothetical protein